jgi:bifunctional N-acetylglucosamine-1-phosphate-uridyltransferase/glucosamine-1-phosphate-acetyltransferase GlmU-like protein
MIVIIMAGGLGKRMESPIPKVLHKVIDPKNQNIEHSMLIHVILTSINLNPSKIFIIVGKFKELIVNEINSYINNNLIPNNIQFEYVEQENPLGTGHAIKCCLNSINDFYNEKALILSGDVPLIRIDTLNNLLNSNKNKILTTNLSNPFGCGRIILDNNQQIIGIKEEKDCNLDEKQINLVNCGIYQILTKDLLNLIPQITNNNNTKEYYLTDIIELMINNNIELEMEVLDKNFQWEIKNVNTKKDLEDLNNFINS